MPSSGTIIRPWLLSFTPASTLDDYDLPGPRSAAGSDDASSSSRRHTKIYCAGALSPRSALTEDISPGSSLSRIVLQGLGLLKLTEVTTRRWYVEDYSSASSLTWRVRYQTYEPKWGMQGE